MQELNFSDFTVIATTKDPQLTMSGPQIQCLFCSLNIKPYLVFIESLGAEFSEEEVSLIISHKDIKEMFRQASK